MSSRTGSHIIQCLTVSLLLTSGFDSSREFCLKEIYQRECDLSKDVNCSVLLGLEARCCPCTSFSKVGIASNYLQHQYELRYSYTINYTQLLRTIKFLILSTKNEVVHMMPYDVISVFLLYCIKELGNAKIKVVSMVWKSWKLSKI